MAEKAGQAVDVAQDLAGDALEKGKVLADQAGDKLSEVAIVATEKAGQAFDSAKEVAGEALEKGKEFADQAGDKLSEVATATTEKTSQIVNKIKGDDSTPPQA